MSNFFETFCPKSYIMKFLNNLAHKYLILFKDFLSDFFETFCPKIYIKKYLKQFSTEKLDIVQNFFFLIFLDILSQNTY